MATTTSATPATASPARGRQRWARSAGLSIATVGLAAAAHALGGGHVPGWSVLVVLTLLVSLVSVLLTGRQRGFLVIVTAMGGLQLVLHQGFTLMSYPGHLGHPDQLGYPSQLGGTADSCGALPGHLLHQPGALRSLCTGLVLGPQDQTMHAGVAMLVAHVVATLLLATVLANGERALWALVRLFVPVLPWAAEPVPRTRLRARSGAVVVPGVWTSVRCLVRRGPPVLAPVVLT